jgi:hypothetical protein
MSGVFLGLKYETVPFALTNSSATDVYTVGDNNESAILLAGVEVSDPNSLATPVLVQHYKASNTTSYTIVPATVGLPTPSENLVYECHPARLMKDGDEVRVTGVSGHHGAVSFYLIGADPGQQAQAKK